MNSKRRHVIRAFRFGCSSIIELQLHDLLFFRASCKSLLILLLTAMVVGCDNLEPELPVGNLNVHFQGGFVETPVQVLINQRAVYTATVSTNNIIGFASGRRFNVPRGTNSVEVWVDSHLVWKEMVVIRRPIYIGINYVRNSESLYVIQSDEPFGYR